MSQHLDVARKSKPRKLATAMRRALGESRNIVAFERGPPAPSSEEALRFVQALARLRHARQA